MRRKDSPIVESSKFKAQKANVTFNLSLTVKVKGQAQPVDKYSDPVLDTEVKVAQNLRKDRTDEISVGLIKGLRDLAREERNQKYEAGQILNND